MTPLPEEQMDQVRDMVEREVGRFGRILADAIADLPARADGNMNARDLWGAFDESVKKFEQGVIA